MRHMGFVGKSRLEAAQRLLPDVLAEWRSHWCFEREETVIESVVSVTAESEGDASITAINWRYSLTPNGELWLGVCQSSSWHRVIFGDSEEGVPSDQVAAYLVGQAQMGLINAVLKVLQLAPVKVLCDEAPVAIAAAFSPRVLLEVPVYEDGVFILLDANLLNAYLPIPPANTPLLERQHAVGGARLRLKLSLPLSEVSVADLSDLHPGDILKADTFLTQPFHLATDRDVLIAKGFLVRSDTRLAVQLTDG